MGVELALAFAGRNNSNLEMQKIYASNVRPNPSPRCPVTDPKMRCEGDILADFNDIVERQWGSKLDASPGVFDRIKDGLGNFFQTISNIGKSPLDKSPPSVLAGMTCGLICFANLDFGMSQIIGPSIHEKFNEFGKFFNSNADDAARMLFSGLCAISTALRATIPVLSEVASAINDPAAKLIIKTAQLVLSAVYAGTSLINSLLAANDAVGRTPKEGEVVGKITALVEEMKKNLAHFSKQENKAELIKNWTLKQIKSQIQTLRAAGLKGKLSTAREGLMLAGAVLSLVALGAALPAVAIGAGIANLVANILEMQHGVVDFEAAKTKIAGMVERKKILENVLADPSVCSQHRAVLEGLLKIINIDLEAAEAEKKLAGSRIAKGLVGAIFSVSAILTGSLMVFASITVPIWPAVATCLSLMGVLALSVANISFKVKNDQARIADENDRETARKIREGDRVDPEMSEDVSPNRYVLFDEIFENCDLDNFFSTNSSIATCFLKKEELSMMEGYARGIVQGNNDGAEDIVRKDSPSGLKYMEFGAYKSHWEHIPEKSRDFLQQRLAALMNLRFAK